MLSVGCLQGFLSATIGRATLPFNLVRSGRSVEVRFRFEEVQGASLFRPRGYGISAVIWLCGVEGWFWRQPAALWAASVPPAFPVAFANGIMTHFPLCAADLTTSRDRRRDHLCTRFGPHKECMREGDTPAVAAETAGKGKASAAGRDSGSGYCKNCPLGCLYSRPHVWGEKKA